jgi:hypothetical protein
LLRENRALFEVRSQRSRRDGFTTKAQRTQRGIEEAKNQPGRLTFREDYRSTIYPIAQARSPNFPGFSWLRVLCVSVVNIPPSVHAH